MIKIKIMVRFSIGVTFNVSVYHRSNCRRSKCRKHSILTLVLTSAPLVSNPTLWTYFIPSEGFLKIVGG